MSLAPGQPPVLNPLPPIVVGLALAIFGVELTFLLAERGIIGGVDAIGWRARAIEMFGVRSLVVDQLVERQMWTSLEWRRFVTYPFVHFNFTHAVFVLVFLLALGKLVGEVLGTVAVVVTFFVSAVSGAAIFVLLTGDTLPLAGGYPAVYGLIGTYTFILWVSYGRTGQNQWQAFTLIGFLLALQLIFGLLFGPRSDWVAEVGGFLTGLVIAPLVAPGGVHRLVEKLRQR